MAKEAAGSGYGTPVVPTQALPFAGNALNTDPGLFYPQLMTGTRDLQTYNLYGQRKHIGAVDAPIFATNGVLFLVAGIGADAQPGYGVTGTADAVVSTVTTAPSLAGATTIDVLSASGLVAHTSIVQVDINGTGPTTTSECRMVTGIAGTTLTLDKPLVYAHASATSVISVIAPFTHTITPETYLPSLTVEKNLGGASTLGGQSLQFAGCRVNKLDLKGQATDTEASFTADMIAQSVAILETPSSISFIDESPFAFSTYEFHYNGTLYKSPTNFALSVDNGVKPTYTMNGSQDLQFNPAVALHTSGQVDLVYDQLDDATNGFWNKMYTEVEASLAFGMTNADGDTFTINCPNVDLKTDTIDPKVTDVIMETVPFEVRRSLSGSPFSISATLVNGVYLAY